MRGGICPKCESAEVYSSSQAERQFRIGFVSSATMSTYVCTGCVYIKRYIANGFNLVEIAEKWERVLPL